MIVGQERAVAALQQAAQHPSHAYLLVGPRGSGVENAARAFAALLIGAGDDRAHRLVERGVHPDVIEFEPSGAQYLIDMVRDDIIANARRAPIEAERKVLIVHEAEKLCQPIAISGNAMLKTLEEPPARSVVVLVTSVPDDLLPTIRSRCQRIDFDPVDDDALIAVLQQDGIDPDAAVLAGRLAGGQLARARALAGPLAEMRAVFASVPSQINGTGARAVALAEQLDAAVEAASGTVAQRHVSELAEFDAEMERYGYSDRDAQRMRKKLTDRHQRLARRTRIDLLLEGVTAIETVYRDALVAPAAPLNTDRELVAVSARACAEALDACRVAREAFAINEKGLIRLISLLMALPPVI